MSLQSFGDWGFLLGKMRLEQNHEQPGVSMGVLFSDGLRTFRQQGHGGGFVSPWTQCGNHPAVHGFPEVIEDHYSHSLDQDRTIVGSSLRSGSIEPVAIAYR